jgi:hypothetical protein
VTIVRTAQGHNFGRKVKVDGHAIGPWSEECRCRRWCALSRTDTLDQAQQLYFSLVGAERQLDGVKIWCILVAVGMRVG